MSTHDWVRGRAQATPERVAIIDADTGAELSYRALDAAADGFAARLTRAGVRAGDRVAVLCLNRAEVFSLLFGCARVGATLLPLSWRLAVPELSAIVADARPAILLHDDAHQAMAEALVAERPMAIGAFDRDEVTGKAASEGGDARPAMILYTSGTTGRPKGAMLPWRQITTNAINSTLSFDLQASDRCLAFLPLFHTGGLNCLATPLLWRGGAVVSTPRFDPEQALAVMHERQVSTVIAVPTMFDMLFEAGLEERRPPSLRLLLCGGAPCPDALLDRAHAAGFTMQQGYGLTEAGPNLFTGSPLEGPDRLGTVGRASVHAEIALMHEGRAVTDPDEVGEIVIRGPLVMDGYFERPEANAETVDAEGWLHTGDLATRNERGVYRVVGRSKEMFISGGENVYPAEVENVLRQHPSVRDAAVVGVDDERWGQVGLAGVVAREPLDPAELRSWARERLAPFKVPRHVLLLDALPLNASGKVIKAELARLHGA